MSLPTREHDRVMVVPEDCDDHFAVAYGVPPSMRQPGPRSCAEDDALPRPLPRWLSLLILAGLAASAWGVFYQVFWLCHYWIQL